MAFKRELMLDFDSPHGDLTLTFDDDGKVAYAYLKRDGKIVGDVWLYNRCPTPDLPEWKDRNNIPFANCKAYVHDDCRMTRSIRLKDVEVEWENNERAYIYIFDALYGVVGVGDKPGYARLAAKDGPLAKVMEVAD